MLIKRWSEKNAMNVHPRTQFRVKNEEILPCDPTWKCLGDIVLSELKQSQNICTMITLTWGI